MTTEYKIPTDTREKGLAEFLDLTKGDPTIYFHGTTETALLSILKEGFKLTTNLLSVSFAKESNFARDCAIRKCSGESQTGAVIAVRFNNTRARGIKVENNLLYLYDLTNQPQIIQYCRISKAYKLPLNE